MDSTDDRDTGIYQKFTVERTDGSSAPGGKHANCAYFVLDLEHDAFARAALTAYAKSCRRKFPALAADIGKILRTTRVKPCGCRSVGECTHGMFHGPNGPSEAMGDLMQKAARESAAPGKE